MSRQLQALPRRRTDVVLREEANQTLVCTREGGTTYVLNPTARAVWELCDGSTTVAELADALCEVFAVPRSRVVADVAAILERLSEVGLVEWPSRPEQSAT